MRAIHHKDHELQTTQSQTHALIEKQKVVHDIYLYLLDVIDESSKEENWDSSKTEYMKKTLSDSFKIRRITLLFEGELNQVGRQLNSVLTNTANKICLKKGVADINEGYTQIWFRQLDFKVKSWSNE